MNKKIKVGDLVTCVKNAGWGSGAIYRVKLVAKHGSWTTVHLVLVFGAFPARRRKERRVDSYYCRPVTLEKMKEAHRLLEALIAAEMNR